MGQIAEDIIEGFQCSWCGVIFKDEHGYPVACSSCWEDAVKDYGSGEKLTKATGVQEATLKEAGGDF